MISGMQFQSHYNVSTHVRRSKGPGQHHFVKNEMEFIQDQQVEDAALLCMCVPQWAKTRKKVHFERTMRTVCFKG